MNICMRIFYTSILFILPFVLFGQSSKEASDYLNAIGAQQRAIAKDVFSYTSTVAHSKSARKVENKRQAMLQTIREATKTVAAMKPFQGDKSLRDSAVSYLQTTYIVLNNEFGKIMNMEEIAEQSYDAMEAYLLAQDIANEHLQNSEERFRTKYFDFASKNNIKIIDSEDDKLNQNLKIASEVNKYHQMVYLVFFKSMKQEFYMVEAITNKNVGVIEQNKNVLTQYVAEGLKKLDTMRAYKQDKSLLSAARQALEFYKQECDSKMAIVIDFYVKEDLFTKSKKAFDAKKPNERTEQEVNEYNKNINEFNSLVNKFNATTNSLNQERNKLINNWNKSAQVFLDKYVP